MTIYFGVVIDDPDNDLCTFLDGSGLEQPDIDLASKFTNYEAANASLQSFISTLNGRIATIFIFT